MKVPVKRKRANEVRIRMDDKEYATYKSKLVASHLSGNTFGIKALTGISVTVIPNSIELIRQLKMLGNNVNQITRAINFKTQPHASVVEKVGKGMRELWQLLSQCVVDGR